MVVCDDFLWVVKMVIAVQVIPENIISRLLQIIQHNEVFLVLGMVLMIMVPGTSVGGNDVGNGVCNGDGIDYDGSSDDNGDDDSCVGSSIDGDGDCSDDNADDWFVGGGFDGDDDNGCDDDGGDYGYWC